MTSKKLYCPYCEINRSLHTLLRRPATRTSAGSYRCWRCQAVIGISELTQMIVDREVIEQENVYSIFPPRTANPASDSDLNESLP